MKPSTRSFAFSFLVFGIVFSAVAYGLVRLIAPPAQSTGYDWGTLLPLPPQIGGPIDKADFEAVRAFQKYEGSKRWQQAIFDANADVFAIYRPILGPDFLPQNEPEIAALLNYADRKLSLANQEAKKAFKRDRPFIRFMDIRICTKSAPKDFSYPSGHSALGWMSAQILAILKPMHAKAILARGREYGESRLVCGVHFPSDVAGGRNLANVMMANLRSDSEYQRLLAAAKGKQKTRNQNK